MIPIIHLLKNQHAELTADLKRLERLGVTSEAGQKELQTMKASLLAHLKIEDEEIYPVLRKAAEADKSLERLNTQYLAELESLTGRIMKFFAKYKNGGSGFEFAKECGLLSGALVNRMRSEESTLYKKYENAHLI